MWLELGRKIVTIRKGSTVELYEMPMMSSFADETIESRGESKIYASKQTTAHHIYGPKFSYFLRPVEHHLGKRM